MLIRVMYKNNAYDMIKASRLDDLLVNGTIAKFKRSSGWVTVGVDPVRTKKNVIYIGPERRQAGSIMAA